jgi:hypothetical protein
MAVFYSILLFSDRDSVLISSAPKSPSFIFPINYHPFSALNELVQKDILGSLDFLDENYHMQKWKAAVIIIFENFKIRRDDYGQIKAEMKRFAAREIFI